MHSKRYNEQLQETPTQHSEDEGQQQHNTTQVEEEEEGEEQEEETEDGAVDQQMDVEEEEEEHAEEEEEEEAGDCEIVEEEKAEEEVKSSPRRGQKVPVAPPSSSKASSSSLDDGDTPRSAQQRGRKKKGEDKEPHIRAREENKATEEELKTAPVEDEQSPVNAPLPPPSTLTAAVLPSPAVAPPVVRSPVKASVPLSANSSVVPPALSLSCAVAVPGGAESTPPPASTPTSATTRSGTQGMEKKPVGRGLLGLSRISIKPRVVPPLRPPGPVTAPNGPTISSPSLSTPSSVHSVTTGGDPAPPPVASQTPSSISPRKQPQHRLSEKGGEERKEDPSPEVQSTLPPHSHSAGGGGERDSDNRKDATILPVNSTPTTTDAVNRDSRGSSGRWILPSF